MASEDWSTSLGHDDLGHDNLRLQSTSELTIPPASSPASGIDLHLSLLSALQTSLHASQQAVLDRDVSLLERLTDEQRVLGHRLSRLMPSMASRKKQPKPSCRTVQILRARLEVLHLGRVQCALLVRAQQFLRAASHHRTGPQAAYSLVGGNMQVALRPVPAT